MTHALIDGDIIAHRAAYYSTLAVDGSDGVIDPIHSAAAGIVTAKIMVKEWAEHAGCSTQTVCMSDERFDKCTWRYTVFPEYKANRKDKPRPPHLEEIKQSLRDRDDALWLPGLEADDVIGILHTKDPHGSIMVSIDKDFLTVPGVLINPDREKGKEGYRTQISTAEANLTWIRQALSGDPTDGYKGVPGIGPKKAKGIIPHGMEFTIAIQAAMVIFKEKGLSIETTWQNFLCAHILRCEDYDIEFGNIKIKSPLGAALWFERSRKQLLGEQDG